MEGSSQTAIRHNALNTTLVTLLALAWILGYFSPLSVAIRTWYVSDIFRHCFLVIPLAVYFACLDTGKLKQLTIRPNYYIVIPIVAVLLLGLIGRAGRVSVLEHIALFSLPSLLFWMLLGNRFASAYRFPLFFVLFSVPVGEELIPVLQSITAAISVKLISLLGIPAFNDGLFITIPEGSFVVAEACSGISFLISAVVFGLFFSYFALETAWKKIVFVILSVLLPIIANSLRVSGIIAVGHYIDMRYAAGFDHLVYGWVFYTFVLICLYAIGVALGGDISKRNLSVHGALNSWSGVVSRVDYRALMLALLLVSIAGLWGFRMDENTRDHYEKPSISLPSFSSMEYGDDVEWKPLFENATREYLAKGVVSAGSTLLQPVDIYLGFYAATNPQQELIAGKNRLFDKDRWTLAKRSNVRVNFADQEVKAKMLRLKSPVNGIRNVVYWYTTPLVSSGDRVVVKLAQTVDVLMDGSGSGWIFAVSVSTDQLSPQELQKVVQSAAQQIESGLLMEAGNL